MIAVPIIIVAGVLAVTISVLRLARAASLEYTEVLERLHRPNAEMLAYDVPDGQDPADVMVALHRAGYTSVEDFTRGTRRILVACPGGPNAARPCVRGVIEAVGIPAGAGIRFADEQLGH